MSNALRSSKTLEFDDQKIIVRELEVDILISAQNGELELTTEVLIMECCGINKSDLTLKAYNEVMNAINELHKEVFEQPESEGDQDQEESKKN